MNLDLVNNELDNLGLDKINDGDKFSKYKEMLLDWNEKINLTSITESEEVDIKHFADCIGVFKSNKINSNAKVIDIGTGAGFPGIPMKIYRDDVDMTLLDSLNKRVKFLDLVINELGLNNIKAIHGRAEEFSRQKAYRESYDICVSRAVANLSTLSEYCLPFVKIGGYFISMKGPDVEEEIKSANRAIETLGGKFVEVVPVDLDNGEINHTLIVIEKIKETNKKYPRAGGKPRSSPL